MSPIEIDPLAVERLKVMLGGRYHELLPEIIALFRREAEQFFVNANQAVVIQDNHELRLLAHSFKSNSAHLGATALASLCADLEKQAKSGQVGEASKLLEQIRVEYQRVLPFIEMLESAD